MNEKELGPEAPKAPSSGRRPDLVFGVQKLAPFFALPAWKQKPVAVTDEAAGMIGAFIREPPAGRQLTSPRPRPGQVLTGSPTYRRPREPAGGSEVSWLRFRSLGAAGPCPPGSPARSFCRCSGRKHRKRTLVRPTVHRK